MRWTPGHNSNDVEDRRASGGGVSGAGLGLLLPLASRFGLPGVLIGAALLFVVPRFIGGGGETQPPPAEQQPMVEFVGFVLDDTQNVWSKKIEGYKRAKLVLFRNATQTACGGGRAAMGPFYCPLDQKVYVDLSFYEALKRRFGAPGDFAQAYVIAHEIGHHVQHQLGRIDPQRSNAQSVKVELQADCYAGVWAHSTNQRNLLEQGDVDEALAAAAAIGDDKLQGDHVQPEKWTHGSSAQRTYWFKRGFERGDPEACDTFTTAGL